MLENAPESVARTGTHAAVWRTSRPPAAAHAFVLPLPRAVNLQAGAIRQKARRAFSDAAKLTKPGGQCTESLILQSVSAVFDLPQNPDKTQRNRLGFRGVLQGFRGRMEH